MKNSTKYFVKFTGCFEGITNNNAVKEFHNISGTQLQMLCKDNRRNIRYWGVEK